MFTMRVVFLVPVLMSLAVADGQTVDLLPNTSTSVDANTSVVSDANISVDASANGTGANATGTNSTDWGAVKWGSFSGLTVFFCFLFCVCGGGMYRKSDSPNYHKFNEDMRSWHPVRNAPALCGAINQATQEKASVFFQGWLLSGGSFIAAIPWDRTQGSGIAWLPALMTSLITPLAKLLPGVSFSLQAMAFWVSAGLVVVVGLLFGSFLITGGAKGCMLRPTVFAIGLICNTFFLGVFCMLLSPWSCEYSPSNSSAGPVVSSTVGTAHEAACFQGDPEWTAMAVVSAVLVPFFFYMSLAIGGVAMRCPLFLVDEDHPMFKGFQYKERFVWLDFMCKSAVATSIAFFGNNQDTGYVILFVLLVVNVSLIYANETMQPCSLGSVNAVRCYIMWWSLFSNVCGMIVSAVSQESSVVLLGWIYAASVLVLLCACSVRYICVSQHEQKKSQRKAEDEEMII